MCVCDRSGGSVCAAPGQREGEIEREGPGDGWRSGQRDVISSPSGWDPGLCRPDEEEEMKPLAFVVGLKITEGEGEDRGEPCKGINQSVCVCVSMLGGVGSSAFQSKAISSSLPPLDLDKSPPL